METSRDSCTIDQILTAYELLTELLPHKLELSFRGLIIQGDFKADS